MPCYYQSIKGLQDVPIIRPSILFIGDSHIYSGIFLDELQGRFPKETFGEIVFQGSSFKLLPFILKKLNTWKLKPKLVVYVVSHHLLAGNSTNQEAQFKDNLLQIDDAFEYSNVFFHGVEGFKKRLLQTSETIECEPKTVLKDRELRLTEMSRQINSVKEEDISRIADKTHNTEIINPKFINMELEDRIQFDGNLHNSCELIESSQLKVWTMYWPESPYLLSKLKPSVISEFSGRINALSLCTRVFDENTFRGFNSNRFFLNRLGDPAFNYDLNSKQYNDGFTVEHSFDLDHLNLIGAQQMTATIAHFLEQELQ